MAFRPYFQWNGTIYTAQQALTFLNNQYPNARYTQIMERIGRTIHWGFNYTNLPLAIQNNLQAIFFKLEDYNFPLLAIELETYRLHGTDSKPILNSRGECKNSTIINIPAINLSIDFADIISQDFEVSINRTGIAIYNVSNKTNLFLDPVTYSSSTITVTGYTSAAPCTFTDIYNADVAGGWGQVSFQPPSQFSIKCKVVIGNSSFASTYFADNRKQITFNFSAGASQDLLTVRGNATCTFGSLVDATDKDTKNGVSFYLSIPWGNNKFLMRDSNSTTYFYSCSFACIGAGGVISLAYYSTDNPPCRIWNCMGLFDAHITDVNGNCSIYNWQGQSGSSAYGITNCLTSDLNKITITSQQTYVRCYSGAATGTFRNVYGRNAASKAVSQASTNPQYLINPDFDVWTFTFTASGKVYRQYEFDLKVQDSTGTAIENVTLSLLNNVGTEVFTDTLTNSSGMQDTQTITRGFYNQTGGDTMYDSGPFLLNVTKTGYQSYVQNFSLREPVDWLITLSATDTETANNAALIWSLLFGSIAFGLFLLWRKTHA